MADGAPPPESALHLCHTIFESESRRQGVFRQFEVGPNSWQQFVRHAIPRHIRCSSALQSSFNYVSFMARTLHEARKVRVFDDRASPAVERGLSADQVTFYQEFQQRLGAYVLSVSRFEGRPPSFCDKTAYREPASAALEICTFAYANVWSAALHNEAPRQRLADPEVASYLEAIHEGCRLSMPRPAPCTEYPDLLP